MAETTWAHLGAVVTELALFSSVPRCEEHRREQLGVEPGLLGWRQARRAPDAAVVEVDELAAERLFEGAVAAHRVGVSVRILALVHRGAHPEPRRRERE